VTNLRKEQQDNLWEGVLQSESPSARPLLSQLIIILPTDDFEKHWSVASKLIPLPSQPTSSSTERSVSQSSNTSSSSTTGDSRLPDANSVRSIPLRVYLPEGAPVLQDIVPPLADGESLPPTVDIILTTAPPKVLP
jgi:autophagy-related protein 5